MENNVKPNSGNGLALAAVIVGGIALLFAFIPIVNIVGGIAGVVAAVLGLIALVTKRGSKTMSVTGLSLGAGALVMTIIMSFVYTALFFSSVEEAITDGVDTAAVPESSETTEGDSGSSAELGTRANPAPIGTTVSNSDWEVTLGAVVMDAGAEVAAANQFNESAPEGMQFAMIPVTVKYVGATSGTPGYDITIEYVSVDGKTYTDYDVSVVDPEPSFSDINEMYPDAVATGNVVIAIPSATAAEGTWTVRAGFASEPYFFKAQ